MAHVDLRSRLRNILRTALDGCAYESSRSDADGALLLEARRPDGRRVRVRFLGLKKSESDAEPGAGSVLKLKDVGDPDSGLARIFVPRLFRAPSHASRVRIDAGAARLEIVCEDVEWWEDTEPRA